MFSVFAWLAVNIGSVIVVLILAAIVTAIICGIVKDKKAGRSTCGNNCAHCAMHDSCHGNKV